MADKSNQLTANIFKALAHPTRVQILKLMREKECYICDMLANLESEQSNTSQHLSVLKNQGIIECNKVGMKVLCRVKTREVFNMIEQAESIILHRVEEVKANIQKEV